MNENEILWGVLEYHYAENLSKLFPYIREGGFSDPSPLSPGEIKVGNENKNIKPCFVLINGTTLVKELRNSSLILDTDVEYSDVKNRSDFVKYLSQKKDQDGALILEEYSRIGTLGIIDPQLRKSVNVKDTFPEDYLSDVDGVEVPWSKLGGRTLVAAGVVQKFSYARACIIKSTSVNETATGSVSYFGPSGLEEEIIFRYEPGLKNKNYTAGDGQKKRYAFMDSESSIIGIHRKYQRTAGEFVLVEEQYVGRQDGEFVLQPVDNSYSTIDDSLKTATVPHGLASTPGQIGIEGILANNYVAMETEAR